MGNDENTYKKICSQRATRIRCVEKADGSVVYRSGPAFWAEIIFCFAFCFGTMYLSYYMTTKSNDFWGVFTNPISQEVGVILFGAALLLFGFDKFGTANSFTLKKDVIEIKLNPFKTISFPYFNFIDMDEHRIYTRYGYSGTRYTIMYTDPVNGREKHVVFPNKDSISASDFDWRVRQRKAELEKRAQPFDIGEEYIEAKFYWHEEGAVSLGVVQYLIMALWTIFLFLIIYFIGTMVSIVNIGTVNSGLIFVISLVGLPLYIYSARKLISKSRVQCPSVLILGKKSLTVNDLVFDRSEIKLITMTATGVNNPRHEYSSTMEIITEKKSYILCVGDFFQENFRRSVLPPIIPDFDYVQLYKAVKRWCAVNKVKFIDYQI